MMSVSVKLSPRTRKGKQKDELKQEIVAQVHKPTKSAASSENDYQDDNLEQNRNENYSHTPSRDVSVDDESKINSKILSLIETEIKRAENNRHSHFTDSRPQSLSFYEDEKMPEELSGNLELLSPEERKHYRKRKEYSQIDTEERNVYNVIQDLYNARDAEDIMSSSTKKSKSRKKRHADSEMGMGDSREMMIPKEKRKSKKKRREGSPMSSSNNKRKHKKKDDEFEPKNDITLALEELQDDVFEANHEEFASKQDKIRKSPKKSDKLYIQKKNKFEMASKRNNNHLNRQSAQDFDENASRSITYPLEIAINFQKWWMRISTLCHGLLGGLALGHCLYVLCNFNTQDEAFLVHYAYYSDTYVGLFFGLCVLCIISVFDRMDIAHLDSNHIGELWKHKKSSFLVVIYVACLAIHLSTASYDDKISLMSYLNKTVKINSNGTNVTVGMLANVTRSDLKVWTHLSVWRATLASFAWLFIGLGPPEDMLYAHLKYMEHYLPDK